jgi:hypothetical protein
MSKVSKRGILLAAAMLTAFAVAAVPAQATITPVNTAISASSTDSSFAITAGVIIVCPTSTFTGTIAADGRSASGTLEFSANAGTRVTCTFTVLGSSSSATVVCSLRITLRSTASTAGVSATGDVVIDAANPANACSITFPAHGCSITVGAQTIRPVTISQAAQTLTITRGAIRATGSGGICGAGSRTSTFTATYRITTPRITIS